jgi:hypothetical protein
MADYIDEMQKDAKERFQRELTPAEAAEKFALHNFEARIFHLKNIDTPKAMTTREAGDRLAMERALRRTHETLRKVGR